MKLLNKIFAKYPNLLPKYVNFGTSFLQIATTPFRKYLEHLLVIQKIDLNDQPGDKTRRLLSGQLMSSFSENHEESFSSDFDIKKYRDYSFAKELERKPDAELLVVLNAISSVKNIQDPEENTKNTTSATELALGMVDELNDNNKFVYLEAKAIFDEKDTALIEDFKNGNNFEILKVLAKRKEDAEEAARIAKLNDQKLLASKYLEEKQLKTVTVERDGSELVRHPNLAKGVVIRQEGAGATIHTLEKDKK